jgi:hypothetical protein
MMGSAASSHQMTFDGLAPHTRELCRGAGSPPRAVHRRSQEREGPVCPLDVASAAFIPFPSWRILGHDHDT